MRETASSAPGNTPSPTATAVEDEDRFDKLVDEITDRLQDHEAVSLDQYTAEYPEYEDKLRNLFPMLEALAQRSSAGDAQGHLPAHWEFVGGQLGDYRIIRPIGCGGMGIVCEAEQVSLRRRVALKIIKPGMDSQQIIARFEAERQALALMDHPNIAKILDAGVTGGGAGDWGLEARDEQRVASPQPLVPSQAPSPQPLAPPSGRPYFVMELVRGVPISEYCDQAQLNIAKRLELFALVCRAVQHAHQKGVIHRDIKPSNVLVTLHDGAPAPKVIDFGLAKAMHQPLTEHTLHTGVAQMLGTPAYMSPEQAELSGVDIDTRSDVYSLGVLLYELLTGNTPFDRETLCKAGLDEFRRMIREDEPPLPSSRVSTLNAEAISTVAGQRGCDPRRLGHLLRGELDWLVMKALEKDRNRRYESASAFAADVQRYLKNEAILACPPQMTYRLRKFLRRNMGPVVAASLVIMTLVGGIIATARQAALAREGAQNAKKSERETRAVWDFFEKYVLIAPRPTDYHGGLGADITLRAALDAAEPKIAEAFADQPLVEAAIRTTLGKTYLHLGDQDAALPQFQRALALREAGLGADYAESLKSMTDVAMAYYYRGQLPQALSLVTQVLEKRQAILGPDHPETIESISHVGVVHLMAGEVQHALPLLEQVLEKRKVILGTDDDETLGSMHNLAFAYADAGKPDQAVALYEEKVKILKAKVGADDLETLASTSNLAGVYRAVGNSQEDVRLHEHAAAMARAKYGPDHLQTIRFLNHLGEAYLHAGQLEKAVPLLEAALASRKAKLGADHEDTFATAQILASAYDQLGKYDAAETLLRDAQKASGKLDPHHRYRSNTLGALGLNLLRQQKFAEAEQVVCECLAIREKNQPVGWRTFDTQSLLGGSLLGQKKYAEAEPLLLQGYQGMRDRQAMMRWQNRSRLTEGLERLVQLYEAWGKPEEAANWRKALEQRRQPKN